VCGVVKGSVLDIEVSIKCEEEVCVGCGGKHEVLRGGVY
jgi:hypothetical protein